MPVFSYHMEHVMVELNY
jgi:hypothetical protein